jgi:YVTN family beta-propeller protein
VTPIRIATNTALPPIKAGSGPDAIAITPDGKTAYVANGNSGTVTPIDIATGTAGRPIRVGVAPVFIAITPDGRTRLRGQRQFGHGDPDPDRHQHRPANDQGRPPS